MSGTPTCDERTGDDSPTLTAAGDWGAPVGPGPGAGTELLPNAERVVVSVTCDAHDHTFMDVHGRRWIGPS